MTDASDPIQRHRGLDKPRKRRMPGQVPTLPPFERGKLRAAGELPFRENVHLSTNRRSGADHKGAK